MATTGGEIRQRSARSHICNDFRRHSCKVAPLQQYRDTTPVQAGHRHDRRRARSHRLTCHASCGQVAQRDCESMLATRFICARKSWHVDHRGEIRQRSAEHICDGATPGGKSATEARTPTRREETTGGRSASAAPQSHLQWLHRRGKRWEGARWREVRTKGPDLSASTT